MCIAIGREIMASRDNYARRHEFRSSANMPLRLVIRAITRRDPGVNFRFEEADRTRT